VIGVHVEHIIWFVINFAAIGVFLAATATILMVLGGIATIALHVLTWTRKGLVRGNTRG
jgi:hypothetical protein